MSKKPKAPKVPGAGGSYVRGASGALSRKAETKPATERRKPPAEAKSGAGFNTAEKEA